MKTQTCPRCKIEKELNFFCNDKARNNGKYVYCRSCASKIRKTPGGIFYELKGKAKGRGISFELKLTEFVDWYKKQPKKCVYCDSSEKNAAKFRFNQYHRLTIDRKDNTVGYTINNILLCCYQCNAVKCDVLTYSEMIKVGKMLKERKSK